MTPAVRLTCERDTDGTCRLDCEADHDGFAGRGSAWLTVEAVRRFCDALDAYPLPLQGAVLAAARGSAPGEVTMDLAVKPTNRVGGLELVATVADTPVTNWPNMTLRSAIVCIPVTYESLQRFSATLRALLDGRADEGVLYGPDSP